MTNFTYFALFLALFMNDVLSVPMMPAAHRPFRNVEHANNKNNRLLSDSMPSECRNYIISKIGDPYDIASFMATCSRARDIIESEHDPSLIRKPNPVEYMRRNRPVRISWNMANFFTTGLDQLNANDLVILSPPDVHQYKFPMDDIDSFRVMATNLNGRGRTYSFMPVLPVGHNTYRVMVFGADMGKSFLMYSALRQYQRTPWVAEEPVLIENSLRDPNPGGASGFIFSLNQKVERIAYPKDGNTCLRIFKLMNNVILHLPYLERINIRYQRSILESDIKLITMTRLLANNRKITHTHIFLDPKYSKAFDPHLPNENVMLIVAALSRHLKNILVPFTRHRIFKSLVKFVCKFRLARPHIRLISDSGNHVYHCYDSDELYSDTITVSEINEELIAMINIFNEIAQQEQLQMQQLLQQQQLQQLQQLQQQQEMQQAQAQAQAQAPPVPANMPPALIANAINVLQPLLQQNVHQGQQIQQQHHIPPANDMPQHQIEHQIPPINVLPADFMVHPHQFANGVPPMQEQPAQPPLQQNPLPVDPFMAQPEHPDIQGDQDQGDVPEYAQQ